MDGTETRPARSVGWLRPTVAAALAVAVLAVTAWVVVGPSWADDAGHLPTDESQSIFQEATGLRVTRVAVTGGGGLVDFRYEVIDPVKAHVVHHAPPSLVDEETGTVIDALFMGHSHGGDPQAGHTYPLLFVNAAGLIQAGSVVSIVVGDARLEHWPVA